MRGKILALVVIVVLGILVIPNQAISQAIAEEEPLLVANFSGHPNNLGGEVGVYGSLEPNWDDKTTPYSWYYEARTPGYDSKNVRSGRQSFRLVTGLGSKKDETWGSFAMDLGRTVDATPTPKKVDSKDVMKYKYLTFWVKGEKGGEKIEVLFRDSKAPSYMPQAKIKVPDATTEWEKKIVPLEEVHKQGVDLKSLDNIGIAFGPDAGNEPGAIIYMDDFMFTDKAESDILY